MATLEKRVQVLFDPEQYARLEAEARAERMSVGALIREAVGDRLDRKRADARAAMKDLWDWADRHALPADTVDEWAEHKDDLVNRPSLMGIE